MIFIFDCTLHFHVTLVPLFGFLHYVRICLNIEKLDNGVIP